MIGRHRSLRDDLFRERAADLVRSAHMADMIMDNPRVKVERFMMFSGEGAREGTGVITFHPHMLSVHESYQPNDVVYDLGKMPLVPVTEEEMNA